MRNENLKVIAVDDDKTNLEILLKNLNDAGYKSKGFEDGDVTWDYMQKNPKDVDIVLLDKMMPRMDGMEVLANMKAHDILKEIPVIIQTGDIGLEETKEGLAAGALYYLEKPFDPSMMISLVNSAAREYTSKNQWLNYIKQGTYFASLMKQGKFELRNIEEAKNLAFALANHAERSEEVGIAVAELIINAIEHGNLEIGYDRKSALLIQENLGDEIKRRLNIPENKNKYVHIEFTRDENTATILIKDMGKGFKWEKYLEFDPLRLTDPNGRGIATTRLMGLDVEYMGSGNQVKCSFKAKKPEKLTP